MGVHQIAFAAEYQAEADERSLKWNFGSRHDRRWWQSARGVGFLYIVVGVTFPLIHRGDDTRSDLWLLESIGVLLILIGAWRGLAEPHVKAWLQRRHQRRLAARHARGTDAYFEELRTLEAYPPTQESSASRQWSAAIALTFGALCLILANLSVDRLHG